MSTDFLPASLAPPLSSFWGGEGEESIALRAKLFDEIAFLSYKSKVVLAV
jgi:hypothetical protein